MDATSSANKPTSPPPVTTSNVPPENSTDYSRAVKRDLNDSIAAFYKDDWDLLKARVDRLGSSSERWTSMPDFQKIPNFKSTADELRQEIDQLKRCVKEKSVDQTTRSLRQASGILSKLQRLAIEPSKPATN